MSEIFNRIGDFWSYIKAMYLISGTWSAEMRPNICVTDLSLCISLPKIGMQHSAKSDSLNNAMCLSLTAKGGERNRGVACATVTCYVVRPVKHPPKSPKGDLSFRRDFVFLLRGGFPPFGYMFFIAYSLLLYLYYYIRLDYPTLENPTLENLMKFNLL